MAISITLYPPGADLFASRADVLVDPVDCTGAQGAGLALAFTRRFPVECSIFRADARRGAVTPGRVLLVTAAGPQSVLFFPTKRHWRDGARLDDIEAGLAEMERILARDRWVRSVALPGLGCGLGRLRWADVEPLVMASARRMSRRGVAVEVYEPAPPPPR